MLITLLWIKIVVTLFGWGLPMLFLPHNLLVRYRVPISEPVLAIRLLGAAYLALTTMYAFGLARAYRGEDISDVVAIGLISNGMAAAIIWRYALRGMYDDWPRASRVIIYSSGGVVTALALGLLVVGVWHVG